MNIEKNSKTKLKVRSRLQLAQRILEESENISERDGFIDFPDSYSHQRFEHESLVLYLLLTCLDYLGQDSENIPLTKWLESKKFESQRAEALQAMEKDKADPTRAAILLNRQYNKLYGVGKSFLNGIESLPQAARQHLLDSIDICELPREALRPQKTLTIYPAIRRCCTKCPQSRGSLGA